jgi:flagellar biosynthesis protein FlhB
MMSLTSSRLQNKFEWVTNTEYKQDRLAKRYEYRGKLRKQVENAFSFLSAYSKIHALNLAREDLKALAIGFARGFPVVSDDTGLRKVAQAHHIECWSMVKLLKVMLVAGRIDIVLIRKLFEYLDYENDLPMAKKELRKLFKDYFGTDCSV